MKKLIFLSLGILISFTSTRAQVTTDTVSMGPGYANQVFFDFNTMEETKTSLNNWHIAHTTVTRDNCIRFNHGAGVFVYLYPYGDNSAYSNFDTSGWESWTQPYNDNHTHEKGAINQQYDAGNMWDFSWGVYNSSTHKVEGDSLYLIVVNNGGTQTLFKFMPISQEANGDLIFKYEPINENSASESTISQSSANGGTYKYLNLATGNQIQIEPANAEWQLSFTRYYAPTLYMGQYVPYLTMGIESKRGIRTARYSDLAWSDLIANGEYYINDALDTNVIASGAGFQNDLTGIGSDWKSFNGQSFVCLDSHVYIVEVTNTTGADYYALRMIEFGGMSNGNTVLQYSKIGAQNNVKSKSVLSFNLYPNPSSDLIHLSLDGNENLEVVILDAMGRVVHKTSSNMSTVTIKTNNLTAGQYWVKVKQNGKTYNATFIKN